MYGITKPRILLSRLFYWWRQAT